MGTAKRERQKAGRQARLEQAKAVEVRKKRTRFAIYGGILVIVVVGALLLLAPDDNEDVTSSGTTASTIATSDSTAAGETPATVAITVPPPGETITGETPCPAEDGSSARTTTFAQAPPTCIDTAKTFTADFVTSEGNFSVELDDTSAPVTVNNFVVLARYHFYDGVAFHRIIPGFVDQAGDAVGPTPGIGGPGYEIPDELPASTDVYSEGSVAMANGGPNTGGSQWFITVDDGGSQLTSPAYSRFGTVTSGIDVVRLINTYGTEQAGTPTREVIIESVTISES